MIRIRPIRPDDEPRLVDLYLVRFRVDVLADDHRMRPRFTSRTRVERRITESGVTARRLRRAGAGAPPPPGRGG